MSLIDELHKLMKEKKYTFAYTAKAMNISSTALHLWLNGNYKGNVKKIEEAVSHFIDIEKLREGRINIDFVETSVAQDVFNIAKVCHVENEIGVCCGVAGVGKTFAVKKYAIENPDVILIEADLGYTPKVLFSEIHKKLLFLRYSLFFLLHKVLLQLNIDMLKMVSNMHTMHIVNLHINMLGVLLIKVLRNMKTKIKQELIV